MRLTASASCELMVLVCVSTGSGTFNSLNCMLEATALFTTLTTHKMTMEMLQK